MAQQGYTLVAAARNLGINRDMLRRWKGQGTRDGAVAFPGKGQQTPEQAELHRLREENRRLQMEREIVKKATLSSTSRCNTRSKFLCWCLKCQGLSRALIQL